MRCCHECTVVQVVQVSGLQLDFDARMLKAFQALATGGRGAQKGAGAKKEIKATVAKPSPLPGVLAGLHLLVSLQSVHLTVTGVIPGMRDCPLSSTLRHIIIHNRGELLAGERGLGVYGRYSYGSPCGFNVWQTGSRDRQVPGLDGLARLQRTEEAGQPELHIPATRPQLLPAAAFGSSICFHLPKIYLLMHSSVTERAACVRSAASPRRSRDQVRGGSSRNRRGLHALISARRVCGGSHARATRGVSRRVAEGSQQH
jgi:hypothetical protein